MGSWSGDWREQKELSREHFIKRKKKTYTGWVCVPMLAQVLFTDLPLLIGNEERHFKGKMRKKPLSGAERWEALCAASPVPVAVDEVSHWFYASLILNCHPTLVCVMTKPLGQLRSGAKSHHCSQQKVCS